MVTAALSPTIHLVEQPPMSHPHFHGPVQLRVEYLQNPLGMDEPRPRFSYRLVGVPSQRARRIQVREAGGALAWDSGWIEDALSQQIEYDGDALRPFTRYEWRVQVKDGAGRIGAWSEEEAWFETGFLGTPWADSAWTAGTPGPSASFPPQIFRRRFTLPRRKVRAARLYATALGVYQVELNDQVVGDDVLAPGWTDYFHRVQYQAYDVTALLKPGENSLYLTLAAGWHHGRNTQIWTVGTAYRHDAMFRCELHLHFADGTRQVIGSGPDFNRLEPACGPIRKSELYDGEAYEAWRTRKWYEAVAHFTPARATDADVAITWNSGAPVRRLQTRPPVAVARRPGGVWIVDFGQNLTGRERFTVHGPCRGATIVVRHGEMLNPDGSLYTANLRSADATTRYTCGDDAEETYEPVFAFYGFRYLEISGWPGRLRKRDIAAVVLSTDLPRTGLFQCSEPLLNRLFENTGWGLRSNFLDIPTDCPQRDERLGWTGDTQVFCNTATFCVHAPAFYTKWVTDLNLCQKDNGAYPAVSPCPEPSSAIHPPAAGWSDAGLVVPWNLYCKYGDRRILERHFDQMRAYLACVRGSNGGRLPVETAHYGDWLNLDAPTSKPLIATAYLAGMYQLLARIADAIGRHAEAGDARRHAAEVRDAFRKCFTDRDGLTEATQTAALLALHFDLLPARLVPKVVAALVHDIRDNRSLHLSTGFLGTPLLLPVLARHGHVDLAYDLLLQTTYPGWLYPVTQGATTMWERWNSFTLDGGFGDLHMNSFNHYAYGAVAEWFFETIAGISAPVDAYHHFTLAPQPGRRLEHAQAVFLSPYGPISSAWRRVKDRLQWDFSVPDNTTAAIVLPGTPDRPLPKGITSRNGTVTATPGDYSITLFPPEK